MLQMTKATPMKRMRARKEAPPLMAELKQPPRMVGQKQHLLVVNRWPKFEELITFVSQCLCHASSNGFRDVSYDFLTLCNFWLSDFFFLMESSGIHMV